MSNTPSQYDGIISDLGKLFQYAMIIFFPILIAILTKHKKQNDKKNPEPHNLSQEASRNIPETAENHPTASRNEQQGREMVTEPEGYNSQLHLFNKMLKEDYFKKEGFDPFKILEEMENKNLTPDIATYNTLLDICVEKNKIEWASALFAKVEIKKNENTFERTIIPDIFTYNTMLKGYCLQINDKSTKVQNTFNIDRIYSLIKQFDPNEISYNTLIDACVKSGEIERGLKYFNEMKEKNLNPDNVTYSTLIKGLKYYQASQRRETKYRQTRQTSFHAFRPSMIDSSLTLEKVMELFNQAKQEKDMKPDEILYNCVIDACMKFENMKLAEKTFQEMKDAGIEPSQATYSILIKGYGFEKNFAAVMENFENMKAKGVKLNDQTYGTLIDACIKCEKFEHALDFYQAAKVDSSITINSYIYSSLIKGASNMKRLDKALDIFHEMEQRTDIPPNIYTYNAMLEAASKAGSSKVFEIYEKIESKISENFKPDNFTYGVYLKALCRSERIQEAFTLYEKLKKDKISFDEVLFNQLLHGLYKARENKKALSVYEDMKLKNIQPTDHTTSILIKIYSSEFSIDEALAQFKKFRESYIPGMILYTNIIQGLIKSKRIDDMLEIYNDMKINRIECDAVLYNTIVSGLAYNYRLKEAIETLHETFSKKIILNKDVYITILRNLFRKLNASFKLTNDLSQDEYEKILEGVKSGLETVGVEIDADTMTELEFSGLNEDQTGSRRRTDQMNSRKSFNKNSNFSRRTMF